jgi:hypothetical protein
MTDDGLISPEKWITHPVSDHGDLERPDPKYADDLSPEERAEFDAQDVEAPVEEPAKKQDKKQDKKP